MSNVRPLKEQYKLILFNFVTNCQLKKRLPHELSVLVIKFALIILDSKLLSREEVNQFLNRISKLKQFENQSFSFQKIFQRSIHGSKPQIFHKHCDNISNTLNQIFYPFLEP